MSQNWVQMKGADANVSLVRFGGVEFSNVSLHLGFSPDIEVKSAKII